VDPLLQKIVDSGGSNSKSAASLLGKTAISNVKLAYEIFKQNISSDRFTKLSDHGAHLQRPLWASTSTKNPAYSDVIYIEELIGSDTVNTVPPATLVAYLDHGKASLTVEKGLDKAKESISELEKLGISMKQVTQELEDEGVKSFADAFRSLLQSIEVKVSSAQSELGFLQKPVVDQANQMVANNTIKRLFAIDPTLWTNDPAGQQEILKRCNWLNAPWINDEKLEEYEAALDHYADAGYTHALLLGMGGSSLAPEVFSQILGILERDGKKGLDLAILDSTDPSQVEDACKRSAVEKTVYIVSSKSGSTAEVNAYMDYFWAKAEEKLGKKAGEHFIAITDPGSNLEKLAVERKFYKIFGGDPMVGGRNSALIAFGLVPAALLGVDLKELLKNTREVAEQSVPEVPFGANPGAMLGTIMGSAWKQGLDKLTVITDSDWNSFGSWLEQLVAESSGKQGKGIVPIAQEPIVELSKYSKDRLFVYLRSKGENDQFADDLRHAGHPVIALPIDSAYDLGKQFYLWEIAVAIACAILQVNSFDQPDVQDNKTRTVNKITGFRKDGKLTDYEPVGLVNQAKIFTTHNYTPNASKSISEVVFSYLKDVVKTGDYVAINAYIPRNPLTVEILTNFRKNVLEKLGVATTLGFGPRFLHSTGQLHKGGADNGVFVEITADAVADIEIPTESLSFGTLERAQAIGDFEALEARGRRVIRIQLPEPDPSLLLK
jgi:transaldolase/glucose-6-phosphate isomerase